MGKSKPRAKSNRSTRERRVARARATRRARQDANFERALSQRFEDMFGEDVPVERSVELLIGSEPDRLTIPGASVLFMERGSADRARAVAAAGLAQAPGSAAALSLAADVAARVDKDFDRAAELIEQLPEQARISQPTAVAGHLVAARRTQQALDLLNDHLADEPDDRRAEVLRAALLEDMEAAAASHTGGGCDRPGEEGWRKQSDQDALARFGDRASVSRLSTTMKRFTATDPVVSRAVDRAVAHWHEMAGELDSEFDADTLAKFAVEHAWLVAGDDDPDGDHDAPLSLVAAAPSTDERDRVAAERWLGNLQYGLWQVSDLEPAPGVWLTDLATGREHYAAVPLELLAGAGRWTVLLGALVALDGVWRSTGAMVRLHPREGDELTYVATEMLISLVSDLSGEDVDLPPPPERTEPMGVLIADTEPRPPEVADLQSKVIGASMPQLLRMLAKMRKAAPKLANTDHDPMVLIEATVAVRDPRGALAALAEHPEFSQEGDTLTWYGRELDAMERETSLAELRSFLRDRGESTEISEPEAPGRWIRGTLKAEHDGLHVSVNSRERLAKLLDALKRAGEDPSIERQLVIDPSEDMAPMRRPSGLTFNGSTETAEAWVQHWPDQRLPALNGKTPRRAARESRERPYLEALLREFEHDSDLAHYAGHVAPDIGTLRHALGMSA